MARTLHFRNQQLGDGVMVWVPETRPLTPPAFQTGLMQSIAGINGDSVNLLYGQSITVYITRASQEALVQAVAAAMQLQGQQGDVEVKDGVAQVMRCTAWWLESVARPGVLPAFGGRFTDNLPLRFVGDSPPEFF